MCAREAAPAAVAAAGPGGASQPADNQSVSDEPQAASLEAPSVDCVVDCLLERRYDVWEEEEAVRARCLGDAGLAGPDPSIGADVGLTAAGVDALLAGVASFSGSEVDAADVFAELGSGTGASALQMYLRSAAGRVLGMEPDASRHRLALAAGRAALGFGATALAVGVDNQVYAQVLKTMTPVSQWTLVAGPSVETIAVHGSTIYAVGPDRRVHRQSMTSVGPGTNWTVAGRGPVDSIAIHQGTIYGVGGGTVWRQPLGNMTRTSVWEQCSKGTVFNVAVAGDTMFGIGVGGHIWKQNRHNMTTTTDWAPTNLTSRGVVGSIAPYRGELFGVAEDARVWKQTLDSANEGNWKLASRGAVMAAIVAPRSLPALDAQPQASLPLDFLQGNFLEDSRWEGASVVYVPTPALSDAAMMHLGWQASILLQPGAVVITHRDFPGCYPRLLRLGTWDIPGARGNNSAYFFLALPSIAAKEPGWLVATSTAVDKAVSQLEAAAAARPSRAGGIELGAWAEVAAGLWPGVPAIHLRRLAVAGATALAEGPGCGDGGGCSNATSNSIASSNSSFGREKEVPVAALRALLRYQLGGTPHFNPVHCAWDALVARVRLNASEGAALLRAASAVQQFVDLGKSDEGGRTLAVVASDERDEAVSVRALEEVFRRSSLKPVAAGAALHRAAAMGRANITGLLLDKGKAAVDARDRFGRQALHTAALHGHASVAQVLLEHGARFDVPDPDGIKPSDLAARRGRAGSNVRLLQLLGVEEVPKEESAQPQAEKGGKDKKGKKGR